MRNIQNVLSNFTKTIDNILNIEASEITIVPTGNLIISDNSGADKILISDSSGSASWSVNPVSNQTILNVGSTLEASEYTFTSLYSAVVKANTIYTASSGAISAFTIKVNPGTYVEFNPLPSFLGTKLTVEGGSVYDPTATTFILPGDISEGTTSYLTLSGTQQNITFSYLQFYFPRSFQATLLGLPKDFGPGVGESPSYSTCFNLTGIGCVFVNQVVNYGGGDIVINVAGTSNLLGFFSVQMLSLDLTASGTPAPFNMDLTIDTVGVNVASTGSLAMFDSGCNNVSPATPFFVSCDFVKATSATSILSIRNFAQVVGTCYEIINCTDVYIQNGRHKSGDVFIDITNSSVDIDGVNLFGVTQSLVINDTTSIVNVNNCAFGTETILLPATQDNLTIAYFDNNVDNERGNHVLGNMVVGDREFPSSLFVGEGGTHLEGISIIKFNTTGSVYTDVTNNLKPSVQTPTTLFDTLTSGNIVYLGDFQKLGAVIVDVNTAMVIGGGSAVIEYWNGSTWTSVNAMGLLSTLPYTSRANLILQNVEEQIIHFDRLILTNNEWMTTTVNGITDKYWIRFRLTSTITISPVLNYLKSYGNTTLISKSGEILKFGLARELKGVRYDTSNMVPAGSAATKPSDGDIFYSDNLEVGKTYNLFGTGDIVGSVFFLPVDCDTSSGVYIKVIYSSNSSSATQADFSFTVYWSYIPINDGTAGISYGSTATAPTTHVNEQNVVLSFPLNQTDGRIIQLKSYELNISGAQPISSSGELNQLIAITFKRNNDSNANSCKFNHFELAYVSIASGLYQN